MPIVRPAFPIRSSVLAAPLLAASLALLLAGCGQDKEKEELLRRVAVAEAAAAHADAKRMEAEKAVANIGNSEFAEDTEFVEDADLAEEEESPDPAPENQGIDNEVIAPSNDIGQPSGRMPA